jgi:hypothetical protein
MDLAEANELGEFARIIARADLPDLTPIIAMTLDDCVELLRRVAPPSLRTEQIAALAAELHKRRPPAAPAAPPQRSPMVGTA